MTRSAVTIPVDVNGLASVPGWIDEPDLRRGGPEAAVLFAHGSNFGKDSAWTRAVVEGLARRGVPVLSFDYAYRAADRAYRAADRAYRRADRAGTDKSRRRTDPLDVLEHVHARALRQLQQSFPSARLILSGKSLGARLSTLLAAKGERCHGLALLGYPLHPRGPDRLLSEHFPTIVQPTLFVQGTRDPLCDVALLRPELARFGGATQLEIIEGADHGFFRPQDADRAAPTVLDDMAARVVRWIDATWP